MQIGTRYQHDPPIPRAGDMPGELRKRDMIDREKVARAILRADGSDIRDDDAVADYHLPAADAAIAAVLEQLKEPSEAMIGAAWDAAPEGSVDPCVRTIWQAMLAAAKPG